VQCGNILFFICLITFYLSLFNWTANGFSSSDKSLSQMINLVITKANCVQFEL
jgi:hypothetical protein